MWLITKVSMLSFAIRRMIEASFLTVSDCIAEYLHKLGITYSCSEYSVVARLIAFLLSILVAFRPIALSRFRLLGNMVLRTLTLRSSVVEEQRV